MNEREARGLRGLVDKLIEKHELAAEEWQTLIENRGCVREYVRQTAQKTSKDVFGNKIYIRGLIELTNYCKNDCYYCGIRRSNKSCVRYRLTDEQALECCRNGYELGFRTFVLQGGEDGHYTDDVLCALITAIKSRYPDCAVTLSLGERSYASYKRLFDAGADRYLLRHETADDEHYKRLHPPELSLANRKQCLYNLKEIGYQVGTGFMVGSPYQSAASLALDMKFISELAPHMIGIGPFVPHKDTGFANEAAGTLELTVFMLSLCRLLFPNVLIPSTTALATIAPDGRERGISAGANVVMPNLSPTAVRKNYLLYDNKACMGSEAAEGLALLDKQLKAIDYEISYDRGDYR